MLYCNVEPDLGMPAQNTNIAAPESRRSRLRSRVGLLHRKECRYRPPDMTPGRRTRDAFLPLMLRATARAAGRGPVILPEYAMHPRSRYGWDGQAPVSALQ